MTGRTTNTQRGSIMITTAVSLFVLMGMLGLSIDLGRVYIAKHEAQAFADLASIAAARHLNGTQAGIDAANTEVTTTAVNANLWNFATTKFGSNATTSPTPTVEFATDRTGPWSTAPSAPLTNYAYVRVTATPSVNLAFLPAVGTALTQQVTGRAVGGVVVEPSPGYLPYTPFAHNAAKDANGNLLDPNYGFSLGQEYAIRWPGNLNKNNACAGDQTDLAGVRLFVQFKPAWIGSRLFRPPVRREHRGCNSGRCNNRRPCGRRLDYLDQREQAVGSQRDDNSRGSGHGPDQLPTEQFWNRPSLSRQ